MEKISKIYPVWKEDLSSFYYWSRSQEMLHYYYLQEILETLDHKILISKVIQSESHITA